MKSIVLLSGGLDSTVILAQAIEAEDSCLALCFDYGQNHRDEIDAARDVANFYGVPFEVITIDSSFLAGAPLISGDLPKNRLDADRDGELLSPAYVPGRNTLFLSYALSLAESRNCRRIYFGGNAADHAFPDCSSAYIAAMQQLYAAALPHHPLELVAPLALLNKNEIVREARRLNVPIDLTLSCYDPKDGKPCGECDACAIRADALGCVRCEAQMDSHP